MAPFWFNSQIHCFHIDAFVKKHSQYPDQVCVSSPNHPGMLVTEEGALCLLLRLTRTEGETCVHGRGICLNHGSLVREDVISKVVSKRGRRQITMAEPCSRISPCNLKCLRAAFKVPPAVLCMAHKVFVINLYEMHSQPYLHSILHIKFNIKERL